jgi:putative ABC transport system substrate-binding protein
MKRRTFAGLGSTAAWSLAARAQQADRVRRIGVLMPNDENDPVPKTYVSAFTRALADLGWTDGRNVRMDIRWAGPDINRIRALAQELVGLQPDIIVSGGGVPTIAVQRETRTIPILFAVAGDAVAQRIVAQLDRPGGNITGFATDEATLGGKRLELLLEIAPGLKRAAFMFNPDAPPASAFMPSLETAARTLKVELITAPVHSDEEIEATIIALGPATRIAGRRSRRQHFSGDHGSHGLFWPPRNWCRISGANSLGALICGSDFVVPGMA